MAMNGTDMAGEVVDALVAAGKFAGLNPSQINQVKSDMSIAYNAMVAYIVANLEINGIQISEPSEPVETFVAGAGDNGGSLSGQIPIVGSVVQAAKTRTQSNGGTGLIS